MIHFLYIIYSKTQNKYYVGETNNVEERFVKHNTHYYNNSFTKIAEDWELKFTFECKNKEDAIYLEKFIKKMKSSVFTEKIIANPEILKDILLKK
jgi:putative endonuclease